MANYVGASNNEEFVEERLLNGLFTGSLLQHKELLDSLKDVDAMVIKQSTLLHVGVRFGKADWVEELLARGADPGLKDESQLNALSSAEEMVRQFPEDLDRSQVLKLVRLVHRRDQVLRRHLELSYSRGTAHTTSVTGQDRDIAYLKSSMDALRQEMKSLVCQLTSSLEELKGRACGRDELSCIEEAVLSTAEEVMSMKFGPGGRSVVSQLSSDLAKARQECVDAMMCKTEIVYGDGVEFMRRLYERLYDEDECTACVLKYLSGDDRVKVLVDCEFSRIGRMKDKVVDLGGTQRKGNEWYSFCDLETDTVYLGVKICSGYSEKEEGAKLARALSQLSLKLVFCNGGRPYGQDAEQECEWMRALLEVEVESKRGRELHRWIIYALNQKTQFARVCHLAAAVPGIITFHGSTAGRAILQEQARLLFSVYAKYVVPALLVKARR
ncbi:uncharacterized protein LOC124172364 [Ischnura elegans]|uniref:uncharacterized protein LOC124172364 n=1 Tax=Ischnura elegans TaxID=197161 RepID=UPI001ED8BDD0|nr:uncharacterized protein LOC124172364 [Ischnura elegans]